MHKIVAFLNWFFRPNTCQSRGCGTPYPHPHDGKCAVCRLPIED